MLRPVVVAVLLAASSAACGSDQPPASGAHHHAPGAHHPTPTAVTSAFSPTDIAWLQLMIPMDEQLAHVLESAGRHVTDPGFRRLIKTLAAKYRTELTQLTTLRVRSGAPAHNVHAGHDMPGMMTEPEVAKLLTLRGPALDKALRHELTDHLRQTLKLAQGVRAAGREPAVVAAAAAVERSRTTALRELAPA